MNLDHVFSPLNSVDLKTLQRVADTLKNSRKKQEKAIGVFLSRLVAYRAGETQSTDPDKNNTNKNDKPANFKKNTGLRDLY